MNIHVNPLQTLAGDYFTGNLRNYTNTLDLEISMSANHKWNGTGRTTEKLNNFDVTLLER